MSDIDPIDWVVGAIIFWVVHKVLDYVWEHGGSIFRRFVEEMEEDAP
jgi:hypothetical protein